MFGSLPPYMSLLCDANFDPLNILSSIRLSIKEWGYGIQQILV